MRPGLVVLLPLLALGLTVPPVVAGDSGTVECRSQNYQRAECPVSFRRAVLLEQKSRSACVEGQTWGLRRGRLWVSDGCAGVFGEASASVSVPGAAHDSGDIIECRSENYARRRCGGDGHRAVLVQQLSRTDCIEGRTWGFERRGGLWVDGGCAGRFRIEHGRPEAPAAPSHDYIECASRAGGRSRECSFPVPVRNVSLLEQRSDIACAQDGNWEWNSRSVRVWGGCAAVFRYWPR